MTSSLDHMRSELGAAVADAPPGLPKANRLCVACVEVLGVDGAAISMVYQGASQGTYGSSSEVSRRLDEYQFTFGEGPCLDAVASREAVLVPDLDAPGEQRWPVFAGAVLECGIRAVFALPVSITSDCVGALDLFREGPGPLQGERLVGGMLAAELAVLPLLDLIASVEEPRGPDSAGESLGDEDGWKRLAELDRVEVYQATGMLVAQLGVDPAEALVRLRAHAMATGQTASEVAWAVIERRLSLERDEWDGGSGGGHDRP